MAKIQSRAAAAGKNQCFGRNGKPFVQSSRIRLNAKSPFMPV